MYTLIDLVISKLLFVSHLPLDVFIWVTIAYFIYVKKSKNFFDVDFESHFKLSFKITNLLMLPLITLLSVVYMIIVAAGGNTGDDVYWFVNVFVFELLVHPEIASVFFIGYPILYLFVLLIVYVSE